MKKLPILFLMAILAFVSCKKDKDSVDPVPTVNTITDNITTNTTWSTGSTYIIEGNLYIDGATLTIQPGAIIKFKEGAQIEVGNSSTGSAIIAEGTAAAPILFTSYASTPAAGDWDAIFLESGTASTTSFKFCTFEYGGGYANYDGMIDLNEASITIENCIIRNSAAYGITLDNSSKFVSFANNTIMNTTNHVIGIYPNAVHTIKGGNILSSANSSIGIEIKGGTYNQAEETWMAQTVPYVINGIVYIESNSGSVLNIQEGTTIEFTNGSQLEVGSSSSTYGTIKAMGTATAPITFTSSATQKTPGDWDAIFLEDGTSSSSAFAYCKFEYGGGYAGYTGMIDMRDCLASFTHCTFENSATYGLTLNNESGFTSFENNVFSSCANHPIQIYGNYAHTIGTGNVYNSSLGILVKGDVYDNANETWKKQSCAYYIDGILYVESSTGSVLNIEAGSKIYFTNGSQIEVGSSSGTFGKIIAQGTSSERIIFSTGAPAGSESKGDWDTIFLEEGTSSGTIFDNCDFYYGGGYASYSGILDLTSTGTNVTISNSTINHSSSNGISVDASSNPTITNVTYNDIDGEDYHIK